MNCGPWLHLEDEYRNYVFPSLPFIHSRCFLRQSHSARLQHPPHPATWTPTCLCGASVQVLSFLTAFDGVATMAGSLQETDPFQLKQVDSVRMSTLDL